MLRKLQGGRVANQRGDTIVEVLISITIVALVLGSAYAITNRSLHQGIEAKERTEALAYLQGQVETLKYRERNLSTAAFQSAFVNGVPINFCLDPSSTNLNLLISNINFKANDNGNLNNYQTGCTRDNLYAINITTAGTDTSIVYKFSIYWNRLGGGPINVEQIYYRF